MAEESEENVTGPDLAKWKFELPVRSDTVGRGSV